MDYRLATAMRGPDHSTKGAEAWKLFVTAPLRWFAARLIKKNPDVWSRGITSSPTEVYKDLTDKINLNLALRFARGPKSLHIKEHAEEAFNYLKTTSQRNAAAKLYNTLGKKGLL